MRWWPGVWLWVAAWSFVGIARGTATGSTLYLGLPGGTSMAYVGDGTGWTAVPTGDLPDIGYNAFPAFADLDGDGDRDALVGDSSGHVVAFANTGSNAVPVANASRSRSATSTRTDGSS